MPPNLPAAPSYTGGDAAPSQAISGDIRNYINAISGGGYFWPSVALIVAVLIWNKKRK